jgi:UDP-hydrolysing UDP-N-acetyl-D-glucosamine 2-epimerase
MRKICVVTNGRADYSHLKTLLEELKKRSDVQVTVVPTGMHLLSSYGHTIDDIVKDGFDIGYRVFMEVDGRVLSTMTKSTGLGIIEFSSYFENFRPDIVVVQGDRFEAFAATAAASMMNIHVAHVGGGEVTGTIDEHLRHAMTKLSHFHFPCDEDSKKRIIAMGERPEHVFNTGGPASDLLLRTPTCTFPELKKRLDPYVKKKEWLRDLDEDFFLVIHHPVTTEFEAVHAEIEGLLNGLKRFPNKVMLLCPNIDAGAEKIVKLLKEFERYEDNKVGILSHVPVEDFVNVMRHSRIMIGNSSSGVREACYFGTPVVNVGNRQEGRRISENVLSVPGTEAGVAGAIEKHLQKPRAYKQEYMYGGGDAGKQISDILATIELGSPQKRLVSDIKY